ncbi:glycerophosphodiester phosphodiesterase [Cohnella nanjingensis]|uniref:Glycerophosphodiester phosphodiesterase n=1 Tax=Cohnella nanjingensis TaxID=1387779 RepID=A0A7X0RVK6_9BACL|nr:glycerophosphodiester phosphodiesterase family protein [Cohnella nanjingensis]MBB6674428.1 glycerophosphodiester phosphodiesterase [Cohnella nanjingensis]
MPNVKYVAHRGYSMQAPENTIAAFELAGRTGFWGIECDTYCTVDGRWIVHHDRTVDRMTDGTGRTKDFAFEEIRKLRIDGGNRIADYPGLRVPTLEEVLGVCRSYGLHAFVEIEEYHRDADLAALVRIVEASGMMEKCSFICFNAGDLEKVRAINADVQLGYLSARPPTPDDLTLAQKLRPAFLDYDYKTATPADVKRCVRAGIDVSMWTVNSRADALPFIEAGAAYVTTDTDLAAEAARSVPFAARGEDGI